MYSAARASSSRLALALPLVACLLSSPVVAAEPAPPSSGPSAAARQSDAPGWPRYFTVERRADGVLLADGHELPGRLDVAAARAAASGLFAGAVLFVEAEVERRALAAALARSGFQVVRSAPRRMPVALGRVAAPIAVASAATPPANAAPAVTSTVQLQTVGLHIGGAAYDERGRRKLVQRFETHFEAFESCYALAPQRTQNASFGVDLLVPTQGGRARVREVRTRLDGSTFRKFRSCMKQAFEAIHFEPPPTKRPENVSYSLLFKPKAGS